MLKVYINTNDEILFEHSELDGGYSEVFALYLDTEKAFHHLQDKEIEAVAEDNFHKWRGGRLSNLPKIGGLVAWEGEPTEAELEAIYEAASLIEKAIKDADATILQHEADSEADSEAAE